MSAYEYLNGTIYKIRNIVYNCSQGGVGTNKDDMLNSLILIMKDYNEVVDEKDQIQIEDFRKR